MAGRFECKVAVVTGAAGGIGRASVELFAREGAAVVAVDLPGSPLEEVVAAAEKQGAEALAVAADVTQAADVERYVAESVARFGGIDAFFNNAGVEGAVVPFEQYPDDVFDQVIAVNVKGVFLGMKHVAPVMCERGGGSIVNTSSVAGMTGNPMLPAYIASKHAVLGLTKSGSQAWAAHNVRVNAVCPAPIETRMMRTLESSLSPDDPDVIHAAIAQAIPLGRYGTPEEVAALVAFLCSDDARFISGGSYTIDGAMTTQSARI